MKGVIDFIKAIVKLKAVERAGWKKRGVRAPESVADHSYGTATIAMLISDLENQDTEKVLRMALLHDLQEAIVGDLTRDSLEYSNKKRLEEEAIQEILKPLPDAIREHYLNVWREYCESDTPEAKIVKYADKLDMLAQAEEYQRQGYNVEDFWKEKYEFQGKSKRVYQALRALFLQHRNSTR